RQANIHINLTSRPVFRRHQDIEPLGSVRPNRGYRHHQSALVSTSHHNLDRHSQRIRAKHLHRLNLHLPADQPIALHPIDINHPPRPPHFPTVSPQTDQSRSWEIWEVRL